MQESIFTPGVVVVTRKGKTGTVVGPGSAFGVVKVKFGSKVYEMKRTSLILKSSADRAAKYRRAGDTQARNAARYR
jgi:hypothetical protein